MLTILYEGQRGHLPKTSSGVNRLRLVRGMDVSAQACHVRQE